MNEHHSYNVWQNIWEGFSQGVTSACGELGMQKMALRERTVAGCGGGGGIAQWQCVFLWLRQSLRFVKWMSTFLHALRRRGWLCFWHPAAFVSVDHRLWNRRRSLNLPPGFVEENLHSFFFHTTCHGSCWRDLRHVAELLAQIDWWFDDLFQFQPKDDMIILLGDQIHWCQTSIFARRQG